MTIRLSLGIVIALSLAAPAAHAECHCVAVAAEVSASVQADVARADGLYARGDFNGALALYAKAYAASKDSALLYAQAMADWQLGAADKAKAMFQEYLNAKGNLAFKAEAEAGLHDVSAGVVAGVGGKIGGAVGGIGHLGGKVEGGVEGGVGGAVGGVGAVGGAVTGEVKAPEKVGHTAGVILGVIAVAAIATVGIHSIAAGVSTSASFDPKFDIGLGVAGVAVGITAIYVAGLTAATGAACGGALHAATLPRGKPIVAPMALRGGGGMAAVLSF